MLRFFGYFKEHVVESALENHRIRKVVICYYLEDSSIEIKEPKQSNSGTPQGQFLKRQVVNRHDGIPFSPNDFGIGADTSIHARIIRIFDCDGFTRAYFQVSQTQSTFNQSWLLITNALKANHISRVKFTLLCELREASHTNSILSVL